MTTPIHWRYHRLNCNSCAKAEEFLTQAGVTTIEQLNARKVGITFDQAKEMLAKVDQLFVVNGKKVYEFNLQANRPTDDELSRLIIGRSNTLRAPSLHFGNTFVVGFDLPLYTKLFT